MRWEYRPGGQIVTLAHLLSATVFAAVLWADQMLQRGIRGGQLRLHHGVDEEWSSSFSSLLKSPQCQMSTFTMVLILRCSM